MISMHIHGMLPYVKRMKSHNSLPGILFIIFIQGGEK